jgi:hypothetical protein
MLVPNLMIPSVGDHVYVNRTINPRNGEVVAEVAVVLQIYVYGNPELLLVANVPQRQIQAVLRSAVHMDLDYTETHPVKVKKQSDARPRNVSTSVSTGNSPPRPTLPLGDVLMGEEQLRQMQLRERRASAEGGRPPAEQGRADQLSRYQSSLANVTVQYDNSHRRGHGAERNANDSSESKERFFFKRSLY